VHGARTGVQDLCLQVPCDFYKPLLLVVSAQWPGAVVLGSISCILSHESNPQITFHLEIFELQKTKSRMFSLICGH
jgi:hypothetical protein